MKCAGCGDILHEGHQVVPDGQIVVISCLASHGCIATEGRVQLFSPAHPLAIWNVVSTPMKHPAILRDELKSAIREMYVPHTMEVTLIDGSKQMIFEARLLNQYVMEVFTNGIWEKLKVKEIAKMEMWEDPADDPDYLLD